MGKLYAEFRQLRKEWKAKGLSIERDLQTNRARDLERGTWNMLGHLKGAFEKGKLLVPRIALKQERFRGRKRECYLQTCRLILGVPAA